MAWGLGSLIGILVYILIVLADFALIVLCYLAGSTRRWLCPVALGINTIPVLLFGFALCSALSDMRTNADAGIALVAGAVMAAPFLACFVVSAILCYLRRKPAKARNQ